MRCLSENIVLKHAKLEIITQINDYYARKIQAKAIQAFDVNKTLQKE